MKIATFRTENELRSNGYRIVVGVDEVGRGPLAGPVVVAACAIRDFSDLSDHGDDPQWRLVRDSKTLSKKQRVNAFTFIKEHFYIGVGQSNPSTIDRVNILQATFLAMKKAIVDIDRMIDKSGEYSSGEKMMILVDGNNMIPHFTREQMCVKKGDQIVKSIAAASIIAKVLRDTRMEQYDHIYPQYGFAAHMGYGTRQHIDALQKYGATPIHRKSFAPVKNVLPH
jgi:ribonuclease HII